MHAITPTTSTTHETRESDMCRRNQGVGSGMSAAVSALDTHAVYAVCIADPIKLNAVTPARPMNALRSAYSIRS
jgi:hypothetical protein